MAVSLLPSLKSLRDKLQALDAGTCLLPAPGVTVTRYIPTTNCNA